MNIFVIFVQFGTFSWFLCQENYFSSNGFENRRRTWSFEETLKVFRDIYENVIKDQVKSERKKCVSSTTLLCGVWYTKVKCCRWKTSAFDVNSPILTMRLLSPTLVGLSQTELVQWRKHIVRDQAEYSCLRCSRGNSVCFRILRRRDKLVLQLPCTKDTPCLPTIVQLYVKFSQKHKDGFRHFIVVIVIILSRCFSKKSH